MMSLKNNVVLITGVSSGIGMACADSFAKAGANVLLCARRLDVLKKLSEKLENTYAIKTHIFQCDVRDYAQIKNAITGLPAEWKHIDILVNNAGTAAGMDAIQEANVDDWEKMIDTNVKGLLYMTREILPQMVARESGHIINIASIAGHQIYPKGVVYCATKFAVDALSNGLRMDLLGKNVRVSQISPGAVETEFSLVRFKGDETKAKAFYEGYQPLAATDVADAVLYAATRPVHVNISEIIVMPTAQATISMIAKTTI